MPDADRDSEPTSFDRVRVKVGRVGVNDGSSETVREKLDVSLPLDLVVDSET